MDLHIKAYHFNHWLLSLYAIKYLHCSVTLLSRGWNKFFGVYSDLDIQDPHGNFEMLSRLNKLDWCGFIFTE